MKWPPYKSCIKRRMGMGNSCKMLSHLCNPHLNFNALPHVAFVFLQTHREWCVTATISCTHSPSTGCPATAVTWLRVPGTRRSSASAFWKVTDLEIVFTKLFPYPLLPFPPGELFLIAWIQLKRGVQVSNRGQSTSCAAGKQRTASAISILFTQTEKETLRAVTNPVD